MEWISVKDALPHLVHTYPQYLPTDKRAVSEPVLVFVDDYKTEHGSYPVYGTANLYRTWRQGKGWVIEFMAESRDIQDLEEFITHWAIITPPEDFQPRPAKPWGEDDE